MEILIIKTSAIGDVTHTLPSLIALRKRYPHARITWLVEGAASDILIGHRAVDRVLVFQRKRWFGQLLGPNPRGAAGKIFSFLKTLRETRYDLAIDFQGLLRSGILMALVRARRKVGFGPGMQHSECSWLFYNERIPAVSMEHHAIKRSLMLLSELGVPHERIEYDFPIGRLEQRQVARLLEKNGINGQDRVVAVNPMAMWRTKLWENEKFAQIADRLIERGFSVVFTGSGNDFDEIEKIIDMVNGKAVNLAGATTLKTLGALYQRAELLLTTDTGPMHIAAAVDTPVLAIFGPTAPWRTGPFGHRHQIVRLGLNCSPCFKRTCSTLECMKNITADQVWESMGKVLIS